MRIVGILALGVSVIFSNISMAADHGFEMRPWQDCSNQKICDVIGPKNWTDSEKIFISNTLNKFNENGLKQFILEIQELGFKTFERSSHWYFFGMDPKNFFAVNQSDGTHAITFDNTLSIVVMDEFFKSSVQIDYVSLANLKEITLLHELAHAFDFQGRFSNSPEFLELAGFVMDQSSNFNILTFSRSTPEEIKSLMIKVTELNAQHQFEAAIQEERKHGMERGLPRFYSTGNPGEAFADIVAFIYFDKSAPEYMDPRLIEYIDLNVLKGARAK